MTTTSASLLARLRQPGPEEAWGRFVRLYTPLLNEWARRLGLQEADAADLVQEVFALLVRKLPEFRYDETRSFRGWLRTVLVNLWRNRRTLHRGRPLQESDLPREPDGAEVFAEAEYRQRLVERCLELMRADFQPATWKAFWEFHVVGRPAAEVGGELGLSVGAVYMAKSRVLRRLREELEGLLD